MTDQAPAPASPEPDNSGTLATTATPETTAETQPSMEQKPEAKPEPEPAATVPEKYEFKLPEGVELDLEPWNDTFKGLKLTNDQAQKLVDRQLELSAESGKMLDEAMDESRKEWRDAAKADKEIGGDKFNASLASVSAAMAKFGDPELKEILDASGLGDHPAMLRLLAKVGKSVAEDRSSTRSQPGDKPATFADALYGTH